MISKSQMETLMNKIDESYPGRLKDIQQTTMAWYEYFKDCDYACILSCLNRYIKSNVFPPTVADLLNPYNEGIERTEHEIQYQVFRNIKPSLARMAVTDTIDNCIDKFYKVVDSAPLNKRFPLANRIGEELQAYRLTHENMEFNFNEWIKEYTHE